MLSSFKFVILEISVSNDFLKASIDRSAELLRSSCFSILYYTEQLRRFTEESLLPVVLLRAD